MKPVWDPEFWKTRLAQVPAAERFRAVYHTTPDDWFKINESHRRILADRVMLSDSVLDAGCGWGRLLDLLPTGWHGTYLGIDLSPDFIALAKTDRPFRAFVCGRLQHVLPTLPEKSHDWGVLVSIKHMLVRNKQAAVWQVISEQMRRVCRNVLLLEYDHTDTGEVMK